jgi:TonB family protein
VALKGLALTRPVGADQVRITSLGAASADNLYTDRFGRIWQERVWPMPFLDAYATALLLPTPDGYVGIVQVTPSLVLRGTQAIMQLMTDQFTASYTGTPAQLQAFLKRTRLLPKPLAQVNLARQPDWLVKTPRFELSVPSKAFPVADDGQIALLTGFFQEGPTLTWDVLSAVFSKDSEGKDTVGLYRDARPPKSAKIELRNQYQAIAERRPPYDQHITRESADVFAINQVIDVPGKRAGFMSSGAVYELGVRLTGTLAYTQASQLLKDSVAGVHILEHGIGEDVEARHEETVSVAGGAGTDTKPPEKLDFYDAANGSFDARYGRDIRSRVLSEDLRQYVMPVIADRAEAARVNQALQNYWASVSALRNNGDLWDAFIAKNRIETKTHTQAVLDKEAQLRKALESPPDDSWVQMSVKLGMAYVEERGEIARMHSNQEPATYIESKGVCVHSPEKSSPSDKPALAKQPHFPADFYPMAARKASVEGYVILAVQVDAEGCAHKKGLVMSSGSDALDEAALSFIDSAEFLPAQRNGTRVAGTYKTNIRFRLSDFQN